MLTRSKKKRVRTIAASEWIHHNNLHPDFDSMQMANARRRVAGRIADEFESGSLLGSILVGIAIKFAFALLWKWFEQQLHTMDELRSAGEL